MSSESKPKYRQRDVLERLYIDENLEKKEIAARLGCSTNTVSKYISEFEIVKPYKIKENLQRLNHVEGLTMKEMGERYSVDSNTISYWMEKHGLEKKQNQEVNVEAAHEAVRVNRAAHYFDDRGYECWAASNGAEVDYFRVHRLLAISEFGVEAVKGNHVHHKNEVKWDNRPSNIEVVSNSEHQTKHAYSYPKSKREEIAKEYIEGDKSRAEIAQQYEIATKTVTEYKKEYQNDKA